jgi:hypothetical protein
MIKNYKLKTGQINFESLATPGAYSCVVIKDGEFYNLNDETREILINKLQSPGRAAPTTNIEDMF